MMRLEIFEFFKACVVNGAAMNKVEISEFLEFHKAVIVGVSCTY